eukprot:TRINITY_DN9375_c0_g1_i6.p4 TRINITY_DN9375_c0_g1~~TRINITY_DN9375_c0_g1_i6.p4  ORF type:complete len:134 (-),score=37.94 TRINITY_DN9375_c0_g1_i6:1336-1737(-)
MEAEGRLTDALKLIKVFDSIHGSTVLTEITATLAGDSAYISLGVKSGHIINVHPTNDEAAISKWIQETSPKLLEYVSCDSARLKRLSKRALEKSSKKRTFKELVKGTVNDWKEGVKRTFSIGSQMRRKEKTLR